VVGLALEAPTGIGDHSGLVVLIIVIGLVEMAMVGVALALAWRKRGQWKFSAMAAGMIWALVLVNVALMAVAIASPGSCRACLSP